MKKQNRFVLKWGSPSIVGEARNFLVSFDGRFVAATCRHEDTIAVWNLSSGELLLQKPLLAGLVKAVDKEASFAFSRDARTLFVACEQHFYRVCTETWKAFEVKGMPKPDQWGWHGLAAGDGLAAVSCGDWICVVTTDGKLKKKFSNHTPAQDGGDQVLAFATHAPLYCLRNGEIYNANTGELTCKLELEDAVQNAEWLKDGRVFAAHSNVVGTGVYNSATGRLEKRYKDAPSRSKYQGNFSASVDPEGTLLATTRDDDEKVYFWSMDNNDLVYVLNDLPACRSIQGNPLRCVFTPDGRSVAVNRGDNDGDAISIYQVDRSKFKAMKSKPAKQTTLDDFLQKTVSTLKKARGNREGIQRCLLTYLKKGKSLGCTPFELRDYLSISSPGLFEQAGYSSEEEEISEAFYEELILRGKKTQIQTSTKGKR